MSAIEKFSGFKVHQEFFPTLREAQESALVHLLRGPSVQFQWDEEDLRTIARALLERSGEVLSILSAPAELRVRRRRSDYKGHHARKTAQSEERKDAGSK